MRNFSQLSNLMIADEESVKMLEEADSARILLISDSHGSKSVLFNILERFGPEADALCFCGDGLPDLIGIIEDFYSIEGYEDYIPRTVIFVQGNGDLSNYSLVTDDRHPISVPQEIAFTVAGKKVLMTHGHRYDVYPGTKALKAEAERIGADIAFYGHTHIANAQIKTNSKTKANLSFFNPGSCSLPRGGLPHTFALITIDRNKEKADDSYFELKWDTKGEIDFLPFMPPTKEINLFW